MGFEKRKENVFCDRYRRHATFRGLSVFFFFARSDSSRRKLGAIRTQERMFQCFQAAQDNFQIRPTYWDEFSFLFFRRCISFLCQNWGARRPALRLAEDLRVLEVHSRLELVSPFPLKKFCCCSRCCCFLYYASSVVSLLSLAPYEHLS